MRLDVRRMVVAIGAVWCAFGGMLLPPAAADVFDCGEKIRAAEETLRQDVAYHLWACVQRYRLGVAGGESGPTLAPEAVICESELRQAFLFPDTSSSPSATQTAYTALLDQVAVGACFDDDLQLLGHLRTDTNPPDVWARLVMARTWRDATEEILGGNADAVQAFRMLFDSDSGSSCPSCALLRRGSMCRAAACILGGNSEECVDLTNLDIPLGLSGVLPLGICDVPSLLPGEYAVLGSPAASIAPIDLGGGTFVCLDPIGAEGYITRCTGGTQPRLRTTSCQDHMVQFPETNECPGAPGACLGEYPSPDHPGNTNGGECVTAIPSAPLPGSAVVVLTMQTTLIFSGQEGPDGIACTGDDTPTFLVDPVPAMLTTGSADAVVLDSDLVDGKKLPNGPLCPVPAALTGATFDCSQVDAGILSGGKLVGAFPSLEIWFGPPRVDGVTTLSFDCH